MAPVGHACWQGAATQCLQTSLIISQRPAPPPFTNWSRVSSWLVAAGCSNWSRVSSWLVAAGAVASWTAGRPFAANCSMNFTCRQDEAESSAVLS